MKLFSIVCAALMASSASAETFSVLLGGKALGQLSYAEAGRTSTLRSTLNNTPLGVFNGTFVGTSVGTTTNSTFTGESRSSRKQRVVTVEIAKGRATSTAVTPSNELTDLSDISRVPNGVMDPVRAVGHLFRASGCPAPMQMYDGRRVVALRSDDGTKSSDTLVCTLSYKVIAGPGHLSPLGISSAKMRLSYATAGGRQILKGFTVSSGIFSLSLAKID